MRQVVLFIALSLDGYIADRTGGVGWLRGEDPAVDDMAGYERFIRDVDTVLMGGTTYRQIAHELSPGAWPYEGLQSYVFTSRPEENREGVAFVSGSVPDLVRRLLREPGKDVWICGGASVVEPLLRENLIDRYHLSLIPTLLGSGVRLFGPEFPTVGLRLERAAPVNGIVEAVYTRPRVG